MSDAAPPFELHKMHARTTVETTDETTRMKEAQAFKG